MNIKLTGKTKEIIITLTSFKYSKQTDEIKTELPDFNSPIAYDVFTYAQMNLIKTKGIIAVDKNFKMGSDLTVNEIVSNATPKELKRSTTPTITLLGAMTSPTNVSDLTKFSCVYSIVIAENVKFDLSVKELEAVNELIKIVDSKGFYINKNDFIESINNGNNDLDLVKKAYGDGWEKPIESVFSKTEMTKLKKFAKKIKIELPEYVYGD